MQLKEKKSMMERDKRKLEAELDRQRQTIGKQVFLQVVQQKTQLESSDQQNEAKQAGSIKDSTPRRQWDKSQHKNLINEIESDSTNKNVELPGSNNNNNGIASSTSSMSTPSSSASQSPPISNNQANKQGSHNTQIDMAMSVDLSKAYYSRDEVIRAIESLKSKYTKEAMNNATNITVNRAHQNATNNVNSSVMVKEIEALNGKLADLQNEINRLTLLQQKQSSPVPNAVVAANSNNSNNTTTDTSHFNSNSSFVLSEERRHMNNSMNDESNNNQEIPFSNHQTAPQAEGPFFISIGNGSAKREKPTLTSKKNQIFVKSKSNYFKFDIF